MNDFTQLVRDSQEWFKNKSVELEHLLDYIILGDVLVPDTVRVLALAIATVAYSDKRYTGRFLALNRVAECNQYNLIPLMLQWFADFIHLKCECCNETVTQILAYQAEFSCLKHLFSFDPSTFHDADHLGMSPFRILYRNFLHLAFDDCHFEEEFSAHLYAYGENPVGNLGIGSGKLTNYPSLVELPNDHQKVEHVSLGRFHSLFLIDGKVFACGFGREGRLGLGSEADVVLPQPVFVSERVISVAAGLSHSVVCTTKKVYTFGSNEKLQLGIPNKKMLLTPTVAFKLKNDDNFIKCLAADSFSVAITEEGRWYIAGTDIPFIKRPVPEFFYCSELRKRNCILNNLGLVYVLSESPRKICIMSRDTICELYTVRCDWVCERCLGIFEYSGTCALIESAVPTLFPDAFEDEYYKEILPNYLILYENRSLSEIEKLPVEFTDGSDHVLLRINKMTIAKNGVFLLTDKFGLVYEGHLSEAMRKHFGSNLNRAKLVVTVNRIIGLPPVKNMYISPDGKNKALLICDLVLNRDLKAFKWLKSVTPFKVLKPKGCVEAICIGEDQSEIARFTTSKSQLAAESKYCSTYFTRWSELSNNKQAITFFTSAFALEQFIQFCATHQITSGMSNNQLLELLMFADEYCCDHYFDQVLDQFFVKHLDISVVHDLCVMARYTKKPRLLNTVYGLCAVFFPLLFDRGLINDLLDCELTCIRNFCVENGFYEKTAPAELVKASWIREAYLVIDKNQYAQRIRSFDKEVMQNSFVNEWLVKISVKLEKLSANHLTLLLQSFRKKTAKCHAFSRRVRHSINHSETYSSESECQIPTGDNHLDNFKKEEEAMYSGEGYSKNNSESDIKQVKLKGIDPDTLEEVLEETRIETRMPASETTVDEFPSLDLSANFNSKGNGISIAGNFHRKSGWSTVTEQKLGDDFSFRKILEDELVHSSNKQSSSSCKKFNNQNTFNWENNYPKNDVFRVEPWTKERGWNNNVLIFLNFMSDIADRSYSLSFKEIVNEEFAQLNETKRIATLNVQDIEKEELAIAQLIAVYEADASNNGIAVTISAERMHTARNNPLWSARS
uniref:BTB domain-containing protein n=1 Tax=Syphacia muris TaxID=451379 RepID=A0A158R617_9BILA